MTQQEHDDFMLIWDTINSPMKAGNKWCQYTRQSINDVIPAIKRTMEAAGFRYDREVE